MKLSNSPNNGLFQELNRLCGTTLTNYPIKNKISDLNEALDWYVTLAFKAGRNWEFDDSTETSPPIDTQNLVSGTNRYKLTAFTEKIINLIRLEVLDANGNGLGLIPETMDSFGNVIGTESGRISAVNPRSFQESYIDAPSGTPTHYIKYGDFIYLRPNPNYNSTAGLKAWFNRAATDFTFVSCQAEADDDLITATAHGLVANDTVLFEVDDAGTMAGGLTADTTYFVISTGLTANKFSVATTQGGSAVNISSDGTNMYFLKLNGEPGIPSVHHKTLAQKAALDFMTFNNTNGVFNSRLQMVAPMVKNNEREIEAYFAGRDKDVRKRLSARFESNK